MDLINAAEAVIRKLYRNAGFQIIDSRKGKVKFRSLQGEFIAFQTSNGWGFAPVDNPEGIHWTVHTKRKVPKKAAFLHFLLPFIEKPAEFHEKEKGKVTRKFRWQDGYRSFGKFIEERRKERGERGT